MALGISRLKSLILGLSEGSFVADLITKGRKTGREHGVPLRLVFYSGRFYASRTNTHADWLKNALKSPDVMVEVRGVRVRGVAKLVDDEHLCKKVSMLKYGDERSVLSRIVVEIIPIMD